MAFKTNKLQVDEYFNVDGSLLQFRKALNLLISKVFEGGGGDVSGGNVSWDGFAGEGGELVTAVGDGSIHVQSTLTYDGCLFKISSDSNSGSISMDIIDYPKFSTNSDSETTGFYINSIPYTAQYGFSGGAFVLNGESSAGTDLSTGLLFVLSNNSTSKLSVDTDGKLSIGSGAASYLLDLGSSVDGGRDIGWSSGDSNVNYGAIGTMTSGPIFIGRGVRSRENSTGSLMYSTTTDIVKSSIVQDNVGIKLSVTDQTSENVGDEFTWDSTSYKKLEVTTNGITLYDSLIFTDGSIAIYESGRNLYFKDGNANSGVAVTLSNLISGGGTVAWSSGTGTDNRVLTAAGSGNISDEANLTFDGNKLSAVGNAGTPITAGSETSQPYILSLKNIGVSTGLYFGVYNTSPYSAWIQAGKYDSFGTNRNITLQPNGGNVGLRNTNPQYNLDFGSPTSGGNDIGWGGTASTMYGTIGTTKTDGAIFIGRGVKSDTVTGGKLLFSSSDNIGKSAVVHTDTAVTISVMDSSINTIGGTFDWDTTYKVFSISSSELRINTDLQFSSRNIRIYKSDSSNLMFVDEVANGGAAVTLSELLAGGSGGSISWDGGVDGENNQLVTSAGNGNIVSEASLIYDGTDFINYTGKIYSYRQNGSTGYIYIGFEDINNSSVISSKSDSTVAGIAFETSPFTNSQTSFSSAAFYFNAQDGSNGSLTGGNLLSINNYGLNYLTLTHEGFLGLGSNSSPVFTIDIDDATIGNRNIAWTTNSGVYGAVGTLTNSGALYSGRGVVSNPSTNNGLVYATGDLLSKSAIIQDGSGIHFIFMDASENTLGAEYEWMNDRKIEITGDGINIHSEILFTDTQVEIFRENNQLYFKDTAANFANAISLNEILTSATGITWNGGLDGSQYSIVTSVGDGTATSNTGLTYNDVDLKITTGKIYSYNAAAGDGEIYMGSSAVNSMYPTISAISENTLGGILFYVKPDNTTQTGFSSKGAYYFNAAKNDGVTALSTGKLFAVANYGSEKFSLDTDGKITIGGDSNITIYKNGNDLTFSDNTIGTKTLSQLATAGSGDVAWSGGVGNNNELITSNGVGGVVSESTALYNGQMMEFNYGSKTGGYLKVGGEALSYMSPQLFAYSESPFSGLLLSIKSASENGSSSWQSGAVWINARDYNDEPINSGLLLNITNDSNKIFGVDYEGKISFGPFIPQYHLDLGFHTTLNDIGWTSGGVYKLSGIGMMTSSGGIPAIYSARLLETSTAANTVVVASPFSNSKSIIAQAEEGIYLSYKPYGSGGGDSTGDEFFWDGSNNIVKIDENGITLNKPELRFVDVNTRIYEDSNNALWFEDGSANNGSPISLNELLNSGGVEWVNGNSYGSNGDIARSNGVGSLIADDLLKFTSYSNKGILYVKGETYIYPDSSSLDNVISVNRNSGQNTVYILHDGSKSTGLDITMAGGTIDAITDAIKIKHLTPPTNFINIINYWDNSVFTLSGNGHIHLQSSRPSNELSYRSSGFYHLDLGNATGQSDMGWGNGSNGFGGMGICRINPGVSPSYEGDKDKVPFIWTGRGIKSITTAYDAMAYATDVSMGPSFIQFRDDGIRLQYLEYDNYTINAYVTPPTTYSVLINNESLNINYLKLLFSDASVSIYRSGNNLMFQDRTANSGAAVSLNTIVNAISSDVSGAIPDANATASRVAVWTGNNGITGYAGFTYGSADGLGLGKGILGFEGTTHQIYKSGDDLYFKDTNNSSGVTLSSLVNGDLSLPTTLAYWSGGSYGTSGQVLTANGDGSILAISGLSYVSNTLTVSGGTINLQDSAVQIYRSSNDLYFKDGSNTTSLSSLIAGNPNGITGTGTSGKITYWTGSNSVAADTNINIASGKLGIGTTPQYSLHVESGMNTNNSIKLGVDSGYVSSIYSRGRGTSGNYRNLNIIGNDVDLRVAITQAESTGSMSALFLKNVTGNVGFGTNDPQEYISINDPGAVGGKEIAWTNQGVAGGVIGSLGAGGVFTGFRVKSEKSSIKKLQYISSDAGLGKSAIVQDDTGIYLSYKEEGADSGEFDWDGVYNRVFINELGVKLKDKLYLGDTNTYIYKSGTNLVFKDINNSETSLTTLLGGGSGGGDVTWNGGDEGSSSEMVTSDGTGGIISQDNIKYTNLGQIELSKNAENGGYIKLGNDLTGANNFRGSLEVRPEDDNRGLYVSVRSVSENLEGYGFAAFDFYASKSDYSSLTSGSIFRIANGQTQALNINYQGYLGIGNTSYPNYPIDMGYAWEGGNDIGWGNNNLSNTTSINTATIGTIRNSNGKSDGLFMGYGVKSSTSANSTLLYASTANIGKSSVIVGNGNIKFSVQSAASNQYESSFDWNNTQLRMSLTNSSLTLNNNLKLQFNDVNTQIYEDAAGNLTFKDAIAGTTTLNALVTAASGGGTITGGGQNSYLAVWDGTNSITGYSTLKFDGASLNLETNYLRFANSNATIKETSGKLIFSDINNTTGLTLSELLEGISDPNNVTTAGGGSTGRISVWSDSSTIIGYEDIYYSDSAGLFLVNKAIQFSSTTDEYTIYPDIASQEIWFKTPKNTVSLSQLVGGATSGGVSWENGVGNEFSVVTSNGSGDIVSNNNLTFNGSDLTVKDGKVTIIENASSTGKIQLSSSSTSAMTPKIYVESENTTTGLTIESRPHNPAVVGLSNGSHILDSYTKNGGALTFGNLLNIRNAGSSKFLVSYNGKISINSNSLFEPKGSINIGNSNLGQSIIFRDTSNRSSLGSVRGTNSYIYMGSGIIPSTTVNDRLDYSISNSPAMSIVNYTDGIYFSYKPLSTTSSTGTQYDWKTTHKQMKINSDALELSSNVKLNFGTSSTQIYVSGNDLYFKDITNGAKKLSDLVGGSSLTGGAAGYIPIWGSSTTLGNSGISYNTTTGMTLSKGDLRFEVAGIRIYRSGNDLMFDDNIGNAVSLATLRTAATGDTGNVTAGGDAANGRIGIWTDSTTLNADTAFTYGSTDGLTIGNSKITLGTTSFQIYTSGNDLYFNDASVGAAVTLSQLLAGGSGGGISGSGIDDRIAIWSGTTSLTSDSGLTLSSGTFGVSHNLMVTGNGVFNGDVSLNELYVNGGSILLNQETGGYAFVESDPTVHLVLRSKENAAGSSGDILITTGTGSTTDGNTYVSSSGSVYLGFDGTGRTSNSINAYADSLDYAMKVDNSDVLGNGISVNLAAGSALSGQATINVFRASGANGELARLDQNGDWHAQDFVLPSDPRLKNDIESVESGLDIALQLKPVRYKWKDKRDDYYHIGFLTTDVEKVRPELVSKATSEDTYDSLSYSTITAINNAAIHELNEKHNRTEKELTNKISDLENKIARLEKIINEKLQ